MSTSEQIREALARIAAKHGPMPTMLAEVKDVDTGEQTCTLIDGDLEYYDVRLRPVLNGNQSIVLFPKVGSWVLAARIENDEDWMVVGVDEIEKMAVHVDSSVFEIKDGFLIERNADSLGQIMDDLCTNLLTFYCPKDVGGLAALKLRLSLLLKP